MRQPTSQFFASLLLAAFAQSASAQENRAVQAQANAAPSVSAHLSTDGRLADILNTPAFAGFAERILPWHGRLYDPAMRLEQIGALFPYHTALDVKNMVSALNHMIDAANAGQTIFYEIYTEAEIRADPAKAAAGIFVFRSRPDAPFSVIAAGGAFSHVASLHEGFPYAQTIRDMGFNAFVVTYRTGQGGRVATEDMARAIEWIFENAADLEVSTEGYSVWGSSAGARMAAYIGSHGPAAFGAADLPEPAAVIMAYTSHSDVATREPPTFVVAGENDRIAPPANMERRIALLRRLGTPVEYHLIADVGHGFGAGIGTNAEGWIAQAVRFWEAAREGR
jgi:acetyl esterase/lipase|tara:strand:+ start:56419 stop:57429 length:1011 start_codon:yes stop_codon:yes gene_type:complete